MIGSGALHHPHDARLQLEMHDEAVVGRRRACEVRERRGDGVEFAECHPDLVDHLRAVRAEPTAALRRVGPPGRQSCVGIGEDRNVQREQRETGVAQRTVVHRACEKRLAGVEAELRAE